MDANDNGLQLRARYGQNERELALGRKNYLFAGSRSEQLAVRVWQILRWTSTVLATVRVIAALISTLNWTDGGEGFPKLDAGDRALVSRGKAVYASHRAACHGANLEGQPNWRNRRPNGYLSRNAFAIAL